MVKDEIVDIYNYRPDRIDVVRNGVPISEFQLAPEIREESRSRLGLGPEQVVVLFVGSGWERKGLRFAIEAVESSPNQAVRLLVAGRGKQIRYQSPRVQFLGEVAGLARIYAAADIFILPTIYDPFSNASLEALASGLPVITTRANGCSEIIENRIHGSIVHRADDVAELCKALDVWSDATWRNAARPTILRHAAQFDISKNVARTVEILIQAASEAALRSGKMRNT
jgi:UDP-glucose:(heptosyl)LPS alpha-1,3-glucosyltransferase